MQVNPYLNFNGDCEAAFRFYAESLGGTIDAMMPHEGTAAEAHIPAEWRKKIVHASMRVGGAIVMGSDVPADRYEKPQGFAVSLQVATPEEAERAFRALSEGGNVSMALQATFFPARFGVLVDRFGIPRTINCTAAGI